MSESGYITTIDNYEQPVFNGNTYISGTRYFYYYEPTTNMSVEKYSQRYMSTDNLITGSITSDPYFNCVGITNNPDNDQNNLSNGVYFGYIMNTLTWTSGEEITLIFKFGDWINFMYGLFDKYVQHNENGDLLPIYEINGTKQNFFRWSFGNLFGQMMQYLIYNEMYMDYVSNIKCKIGFLHDEIVCLKGGTVEMCNDPIQSPYCLPFVMSNRQYVNLYPFASFGVYTLLDIIKNEDLPNERQLYLLYAMQTIVEKGKRYFRYSPFRINDDDYQYNRFWPVQFCKDDGTSITVLLNEAIQNNETIDIKEYVDYDHMWLCEYTEASGMGTATADKPMIQKYKPYVRIRWIRPLSLIFPDDVDSNGYLLCEEITLDTVEDWKYWILVQNDRLKRTRQYMKEMVEIALSTEERVFNGTTRTVYLVDAIVEYSTSQFSGILYTLVLYINTIQEKINAVIKTVFTLYDKDYANKTAKDVEEITSGLCTVDSDTGSVVCPGLEIITKYKEAYDRDVFNNGTEVNYISLDETYAEARRGLWVPFALPDTENGIDNDESIGYKYAKFIDNLELPIEQISDIRKYYTDRDMNYIYSRNDDQDANNIIMTTIKTIPSLLKDKDKYIEYTIKEIN